MDSSPTTDFVERVEGLEMLLARCQDWFEQIDIEASGFDTLEEALEELYPDGGFTLQLYRDLKNR